MIIFLKSIKAFPRRRTNQREYYIFTIDRQLTLKFEKGEIP